MDSITHALYKAVAAADRLQRADGLLNPDAVVGLRPFAERQQAHKAFADAKGTDLHIELGQSDETLALFLELTALGLAPPVGLVHDGADVILAQGTVEVYSAVDDGAGIWCATLAPGKDGRRAEWKAELV